MIALTSGNFPRDGDGEIEGASALFANPLGITYYNSELYIADSSNSNVKKITFGGTYSITVTFQIEFLSINSPTGILYVAVNYDITVTSFNNLVCYMTYACTFPGKITSRYYNFQFLLHLHRRNWIS